MEQGTLPGGPGHRGVCMLFISGMTAQKGQVPGL